MLYRDEIIAEVWRNRDAYAARHHYRLDEMVADLRERQKRPGCKLVDRRDTGLDILPGLKDGDSYCPSASST